MSGDQEFTVPPQFAGISDVIAQIAEWERLSREATTNREREDYALCVRVADLVLDGVTAGWEQNLAARRERQARQASR